jgi:hypothetical protein
MLPHTACVSQAEQWQAMGVAFGFAPVPQQQPTMGLRVGLTFFDSAANQYFRFDGSTWAPVTLT